MYYLLIHTYSYMAYMLKKIKEYLLFMYAEFESFEKKNSNPGNVKT